MFQGWCLGLMGALGLVQAAGCGVPKPALRDGGQSEVWTGPDGPDVLADVATIDASVFESPPPSSGGCPSSLRGTAPFGCAMNPRAPVDPLGERRFAIYFPNGRVAGAPVVLAMSLPGQWELSVSAPVALDTDGGAAHLRLGDIDTNVDATLAPGADEVSLRVELFRPLPWDEPSTFVTTTLAFAGDAPEPVLTARHNWLSPVSGVDLTASAPIDPGTLTQLHVLDGVVVVPTLSTTDDGALIRVRPPPPAALPPARPLQLVVGGVRDIIGRVVRLNPVPSLTTSATIADLTFATPPTADTIASSTTPGWLLSSGGVLQLPDMPNAGGDGSYTIVLPLGAVPAGTSRARLRMRPRCSPRIRAPGTSALALVNEQGLATSVAGLAPCAPAGVDPSLLDPDPGAVVDLPGPGRLFLVLDNHIAVPDPYSDVSGSGERIYFIDDIAFE